MKAFFALAYAGGFVISVLWGIYALLCMLLGTS